MVKKKRNKTDSVKQPKNGSEAKQLAIELHRPARVNFATRRVITLGIDDLWQADLIEMFERKNNQRKAANKGYKYCLVVIDTFSKVAFVVPLKTKNAQDVTSAMESIFTTAARMSSEAGKNKRHPKNLHTDEGKEFFNSVFQDLMKRYKINHYHTHTNKKASIVERFNRTLKEKLYRYFTEKNTIVWTDAIQDIVDEYNHTVHSTIRMRPVDVNSKNEHEVLERLRPAKISVFPSKFKINDLVRISKSKSLFDKSYLGNWTEELFRIKRVKNTVPVVYELEDLLKEPIVGTFYEKELQKTKLPDYFRIEKVLKEEKRKGKSYILVRWKGYDSRFDSWIKKSQSVLL